jgi:hypothetical protein
MTKPRSPGTKLLFVLLLLPVTGYALFWIFLVSLASFTEGWHPSWFGEAPATQVIVIAAGNSPEGGAAELVPYATAAAYVYAHPGSTLLVPIGRLNDVKEQLKASLKIPSIDLEIKPLSDGNEEITLEFMDRTDDSHGVRYKATRDAVELRSSRYAGDRDGIGILLMAMGLTVLLHLVVIGYFAFRAIYEWSRQRAEGRPLVR